MDDSRIRFLRPARHLRTETRTHRWQHVGHMEKGWFRSKTNKMWSESCEKKRSFFSPSPPPIGCARLRPRNDEEIRENLRRLRWIATESGDVGRGHGSLPFGQRIRSFRQSTRTTDVFYELDWELSKLSSFFFLTQDFGGIVNIKYFRKMLTVTQNQEWKDIRSAVTPTFTSGKIKRVI